MEFQTLYKELANSTEIIRALIRDVDQEQAQARPEGESWSILEVICHLYDEEREDFREHLDFILYRQNEAWHPIDPEGWVIKRKYNEQNFVEAQKRFFTERNKSLEWLKGLAMANWDTTYTSQFGSMKAGDLLASWIAHDNLHIRQLVELQRNLIEKLTKPYEIGYAGDW